MPELLEVERYRQSALATVGHRIVAVTATDDLMTIGLTGAMLADAITGAGITAARRRGKLMLLDLNGGDHVLGVHFGMTGRLVVGDDDPIEALEYLPRNDDAAWDRFVFDIEGVGIMRLNDPRRLGRVTLDPDEGVLGPDAATVTTRQLTVALDGSRTSLKARLLDQRRIAGIGNLLADEILWRARLAPGRPAGQLDGDQIKVLARTIRTAISLLTKRGGSHLGDLQAHRVPGSSCPRCHHPLRREQWGGRTTYWCPKEQR